MAITETERDEARHMAIGWLISTIESDFPGYMADVAKRAKEYPPMAAMLADWGKRLRPQESVVLRRRCEDCRRSIAKRSKLYTIRRPDRSLFWLCERCWDNLVGAATMQAVR